MAAADEDQFPARQLKSLAMLRYDFEQEVVPAGMAGGTSVRPPTKPSASVASLFVHLRVLVA